MLKAAKKNLALYKALKPLILSIIEGHKITLANLIPQSAPIVQG